MACLKDGADLHGKRQAAVIALVHAYTCALALHLAILLNTPTVRADRSTRPDAGFHEGVRGLLVVEVRGRKDGVHVFFCKHKRKNNACILDRTIS
jgi:hypothetical protein